MRKALVVWLSLRVVVAILLTCLPGFTSPVSSPLPEPKHRSGERNEQGPSVRAVAKAVVVDHHILSSSKTFAIPRRIVTKHGP